MYTYNVTVKITSSIESSWLEWMKEEHIPDVLSTNLFTGYRFHQLIEPKDENDDGLTFVVQYFVDNLSKYEHYITHHAPLLRQKGFDRFGDQFIAFRTLLKNV